jgi:hypothetical protein
MPKKTKRKVTQVVTPAPSPEVMEVTTVTEDIPVREERPAARPASAASASRPAAGRSAAFNRRTTYVTEFNPDYSYVVKDLKRIGTLAGFFFVVLIILSFIIQ